MGACWLCEATMMLTTKLLLSLILCLAYHDGADAESSPKRSLEDWETLVEKLESRLRKFETRVDDEERKLEAEDKEMEMRLEELEVKIKEGEKREVELEASMSKLKKEVEESLRKEIVANLANNTLEKPSLRDLPIVLISAWRADELTSPQTVTFDSFLTNFNNQDRPGGGSGVLDLDSGVFTCFTPGYYTVSFSAYGGVGPSHSNPHLFLFKNGSQLPESEWYIATSNGGIYDDIGVTSSRILILHMDAGDTLELRMTRGDYIHSISINIELTGLGFDYIV